MLPPNRRRSIGFSCIAPSKKRDALLVRMIKPNLISSHDWHVQPSCQRSLRAVRLSGALGIEVRPFGRLVLELVRMPDALNAHTGYFCANLSNVTKISPLVKPDPSARGPSNSLLALLARESDQPCRTSLQKPRSAQNIKQQPAHSAPEPLRLTGVSSWVLQ